MLTYHKRHSVAFTWEQDVFMNLIHNMCFGNYIFEITTTSPRGLWVKAGIFDIEQFIYKVDPHTSENIMMFYGQYFI